jgi:siroheme synthase (precorrin-2 oxidase/ferrochelatase)
METITYQITIKKEYASAILEELMLNEAIEYLPNNIPEWQIIESRKRLAEMKANPSSTINGDDFFDSIIDD